MYNNSQPVIVISHAYSSFTLKSILRKHAARFGCQWDRFLPGILWAYRNTPHTSTGEKPSFLLYGVDCRSPTEAAYLPPEEVYHTDVEDYREELMLTLSSARQLAASCIQRAQMKYKEQYDRKAFQILAIDVMDLPPTERGNKHVVVIQDLFTKWPFVFAVPDQKTDRIARLIAEEVVPCFGVPECLLSDRGTNLVSKLMMDLCKILGITKLSTTAYHPQCDGAVERFNRTLKSILRKHAARFGCQWDRFLPGILWAYRNTPHTSTGEKPSFLLYGVDCRSPTEAAYLPPEEVYHTDVEDYREELMLTLSSARQLAASCIQRAQMKYKEQYDRKAKETTLRIGDWVLIRFPQDESGRWRKLCRPWHGPYRVTDRTDPDVTCVKVYHPQEDTICVHQSRVCRCPDGFPAGYYWYGGRRKGPGRPPKWVELLLQSGSSLKDDELMALQKRVEILEVRPTRESPGESGTGDKGVVGVTGHAGRAVPGGAVVPVLDPGRDHTHSSPFTPTEERGRGVRRTHAIGGLRTIGESGRTDAGPSKHSTPTIGEPHDGSMRRGKAPPIDAFDGESPDVLFEDWLPGLQRAAQWNGWSKDETLIQLAGHLRGRALQEWGLLSAREQESLEEATIALRSRLEPSSRALAAQDFRHASQRDKESVADFIRRLEQLFKLAYGREGMSDETRGTLLHSQLQEGLRYDIMEAPAVSGSHDYRELCLASRNEEKRLVELAKRRQYTKSPQQLPPRQTPLPPANQMRRDQVERPRPQGPYSRRPDGDRSGAPRRCYNCDQLGHMSWDCPSRRTESTGRGTAARSREAGTKQVRTAGGRAPSRGEEYSPVGLGAFSCLLSSDSEDEEDGVRLVRISDQGSEQQHADVLIEGVPAKGVIDSGAEITIMGGKLFARIAAVARLKKSRLKASDKIPKTYDRRSFTLDGRMDLDVCFNGIEMRTPVYIKLDAPEQLLIAEGVCRQLGIIKYHPSIVDEKHRSKDGAKRWKRSQNRDQDYPAEGKRCKVSGGEVQEGRRHKVSGGEVQEGRRRKVSGGEVLEGENSGGESPGGVADTTTTLTQTMTEDMDYAIVPMVRVRLVTALRVPPHQFVFAKVRVDGDYARSDPLLFQHQEAVEESLGVRAGDALVHLNEDCTSQIFLMNTTGFTRRLEEGEVVGEAVPAVVVNPSGDEVSRAFTIYAVTQAELEGEANTREAERRKKLIEELKEPDLPSPEREILLDFLAAHNHAFSLSDNEK